MASNYPDTSRRLNGPLVRALMWGANIPTLTALAEEIGVDKGQLSRALRAEYGPSMKMVDGLARRFPLVPYAALVVLPGDPDAEPEALGLRPEHLADTDDNGTVATPPDTP